MNTIRLFNNIKVDCISKDEVLSWAVNVFNENKQRQYILCINPEKINLLKKNKISISIIDDSSLRIPDGVGIVWAIKKIKGIKTERLTGVDLFSEFLILANKLGKSIFIYGGKEEVLEKSVLIIKKKYPNLKISGYNNGYMKNKESTLLVDKINSLKPDFLFLGLGSPKQENWVSENLDNLDVGIVQTIGGSLDTIATPSMRAPKLVQKMGLEWLYRLLKQPLRAKRQLTLISFFLNTIFYKDK